MEAFGLLHLLLGARHPFDPLQHGTFQSDVR